MDEPGLNLAVVAGAPLISEVSMNFEPLTFRSQALMTKEFQNAMNETFGAGAVIMPRYGDHDLKQLAESLASKGKQLDQKTLAGLSPKGIMIEPAGQVERADKVVTVNHISIGDMGLSTNVSGTSDDCMHVIRTVAELIGKSTGDAHDWDYYSGKAAYTRYGTTTVTQFSGNLRDILSDAMNAMFETSVENDLAIDMAPQRAGVDGQKLAFARVMVHELSTWVTLVERDGTTNQARLDFSYKTDEDIASRRLHVTSQLDYDSHQKLLTALQAAMMAEEENS